MDIHEPPATRTPEDRIRAKDSALRASLAFVEDELERRREGVIAEAITPAACLVMQIEDALKW